MPLRNEGDVLLVRQMVRELSKELKFGTLDQTKIVTAVSELARNTLIHGGGGTVVLEVIELRDRPAIRLTFEDTGPGIPDLARAMVDGFTTKGGMGLGLGGSKRLVNEFDVVSTVGVGTRITVTKWAV